MEENIIVLSFEGYRKLLQILKDNPERINFKCVNQDKILSVNVKNDIPKERSVSKQQNIVENWMNQIIGLAEEGYQQSDDDEADKFFKSIMIFEMFIQGWDE